jgi:dienelactone hydrolase
MHSVWAATAAAFVMAGAAQAAPPPASAFGRIPAVVDAAISPNGQRVAILGGAPDQRFVSIATIDQQGLPILKLGEVEGLGVQWAGDDYVIATIGAFETVADMKRSYHFERHISVTTEAKPAATLLQNGLSAGERFVTEQPILRMTNGAAARVMMLGLIENSGPNASNDTRLQRKGEGGASRALWRVNPANGQGELVERGGFDTRSWCVDSNGEARVRLDVDEVRHTLSLYGRPKGAKTWTPVFTNVDRDRGPHFVGYLEADDAVLVSEGGKIVKRSLADGSTQAFDARPGERLVWDAGGAAVIGLATEADQPSIRWLDPEMGAAHETLKRAFKGQRVTFWSWSRDRTRFVVRVSGPTSPPAWYLYDKPRKEVSALAQEYPELNGVKLAPMAWSPFKARDGLEIPAYLTMPSEPPLASGKRPLIVLPHDGPHERDVFGFDYLAQFLASRGYAVLQPQFRGSAGFGDDFFDAGRGEWGGKIQTDILDGVAALAARGDVDTTRVCIVGVGFGGYSALAAATLHPNDYKCAASIAGYSNLGKILADQVRLYAPESEAVIDAKTELGGGSLELVAAQSPDHHALAVNAPILLIHGDKDTVVPMEHSQVMADRLKEAGKSYELVILPGENHDLAKGPNRIKALETLEQFLAKNLPVN